MPRYSERVLSELSDSGIGMLTGQAIANVGQRVSQIIPNIAEKRKEADTKAASLQLAQAYASGDPAQIAAAGQLMAPYNPTAAFNAARTASELSNRAGDQEAASRIADITQQIRGIAQDETKSRQQRAQEIAPLQAQINAIGKQTNLNLIELGQISSKVINQVDQENAFRAQQEREEIRFNRWQEDLKWTDEERAMARAKFAEWEANGLYREYIQEATIAKAKTEQMGADAKLLSKEQYDAKYGTTGSFIWETVQQEMEAKDLQIKAARERLNKETFDYTEDELTDLGFDAKAIAALKKSPADAAHRAVIAKLVEGRAKLPPAAYGEAFGRAALNAVAAANDLDLDDEEELLQAKSLASELGLKASSAMAKTNNIDDGLAVIAAYKPQQPTKRNDTQDILQQLSDIEASFGTPE